MLAASPRYFAALRDTHSISVAVTLYRPSAPTVPIETEVVGGSFTMDKDASVLRQASVDVAFSLGDALTVDVVRELPFGGYAVLERGIRYADGSTERVQLGRLRIESVVWSELQGTATLTLADRMAQIRDEPFTTPFVPNGQHPSDAIVAAVQGVFGSTIAYHVTTTPASEPTLMDAVYEQDRAAAISDLASSISADAHFDNFGDFVLRPKPQDTQPVWTVDAGVTGALIAAEETLDRSNVRNGVSVVGQASADLPPIYALAVNSDPSSPTRWGGPFGKVALVSTSTAISSQAQADATAASLLNLRLGLSRTLVIRAIPNSTLEPDDVLQLVHADGRQELQRINAVEIGLDTDGELQITTTSQYLPTAPLDDARLSIYQGERMWRELADASLVAA